MKTLEIIGFKRANLGKAESKKLRLEGNVPCVIYGGERQVHFFAPMIHFRALVYTPDIHYVNLNVEGEIFKCVLQDIQFHPVSEMILHADFLELKDDRLIKMLVPVKFIGESPGILKGGRLMVNTRKLLIKALPANMPEDIVVDMTDIDLGKTVKVRDIEIDQFEILNNPQVTIASVSIPRIAKLEDELEEEEIEGEEGEEGEEGAEGTEKSEGGDKKGSDE